MPTSEQIAWAAGLFEGEGSIGPRSIAITQKDLWCINEMRSIFGGTVGNRRKDGTSQWWICGQSARDLVKLIGPLLSPRRQLQIKTKFRDDQKLLEDKLISRKIKSEKVRGKTKRDELGRFENASVS